MPRISNIKISAKIELTCLDTASIKLSNNGIAIKLFCNYITFFSKFTYIIFKGSKNQISHVNITRLKNDKEIEQSLDHLNKILGCQILNFKVDNIIATDDFHQHLNLKEIAQRKIFEKVKYNSEQFPGLFIKFNTGTVILFHSGKIVIVGCKTQQEVWKLSDLVITALQE